MNKKTDLSVMKNTEDYMINLTPTKEQKEKLDKLIRKYQLPKKEIFYHFNYGSWYVDLANTKESQINYDFYDLIYTLKPFLEKEEKETQKEFNKRLKETTEQIQTELITLYEEYKTHIISWVQENITKNMNYQELLELFQNTWGNAPFPLKPLLEQMALLMGDNAVIQNVVGDSGSFKSTRSMIEFNTLPRVLIMDDATLAGISRMQLTQGETFLNNTIVYYNDVGDSGTMKKNFNECLETVYKKLYSEGRVNRVLTRQMSDYTIRLQLKTPSGFKMKCNSVRPLFTEDYGQTKNRIQTINIPSISEGETLKLIRTGKFGETNKSLKDPRYFKLIFEAYMTQTDNVEFTNEFKEILSERAIANSNGEINFHNISRELYINEQMFKLYGKEFYKELYFNPTYIAEKSTPKNALKLKEHINRMVKIMFGFEEVQNHQDVRFRTIAKTKSSHSHRNNNDYDAFTITAVNGIRTSFVQKHKAEIPTLIKILEDNEEIMRIGEDRGKNIYVLIDKDKSNVSA